MFVPDVRLREDKHVHGTANTNKQKIRVTLNFQIVQVLRHEDE